MGLIGAVGALGGLGVNLAFRQSFQQEAGTGTAAFVAFLGFYAVCSALTWAVYLRKQAARPATEAETGAGADVSHRLDYAEV